jgi:arylsulfatase A-like enzyme
VGIIIAGLLSGFTVPKEDSKKSKPNFIIIYTDDQGYNDLGCYGSKTIKTPRLDRMASEGVKFTSFYTQPVCGPSRGALMTGKYPLRIGGGWKVNSEEVTIAEVLKKEGYSTGCIGKWDMSQRTDLEGSVPNDQGFDYYYGTLGATDRGIIKMHRNKDSLFTTADMGSLTNLYTEEAIAFIKKNKEKPFFLYLAHSMPHVKIDASPKFKGKSAGELYGDVIEELDWNIGRVFDIVKDLGLDNNTYILYSSDNGPWSSREQFYRSTHGGQLATGNANPLRSSKGSPYEGGFRVPCIFWGPGKVKAGVTQKGILSNLDINPTFAKLAGAIIPRDRILDGLNQSKFMTGVTEKSARSLFYYHVRGELQAVRYKNWKLMVPNTTLNFFYVKDPERPVAELYDLENDISEKTNVADKYPKITKQLLIMVGKGPNKPDALDNPK